MVAMDQDCTKPVLDNYEDFPGGDRFGQLRSSEADPMEKASKPSNSEGTIEYRQQGKLGILDTQLRSC